MHLYISLTSAGPLFGFAYLQIYKYLFPKLLQCFSLNLQDE